MSFRKDILRTVQANPGLTLHEIADKLRARNKMAHISTQLSIEFGMGNVRRKGVCRAYTYFSTAITQAAIDRKHGECITRGHKTAGANAETSTKPLSRLQEIVAVLGKSANPLPLAAIARAMNDAGADWARHTARVSASLGVLVSAGRAQRLGEWGNYHYTLPNRDTRNFEPTQRVRTPRASKPKPASRIVISARKQAPPAPAASPKYLPPPLSRPQQTARAETVDEFLARGGRIQRLPQGASATPLNITRADIDAQAWRHRLVREADSQ